MAPQSGQAAHGPRRGAQKTARSPADLDAEEDAAGDAGQADEQVSREWLTGITRQAARQTHGTVEVQAGGQEYGGYQVVTSFVGQIGTVR